MLDASSVAVYVTVVVPISKVDPGLWLEVSVTISELSVAVGSVHVTSADAEPTSVLTVILDGIFEIVGSSLSKTRDKMMIEIDYKMYLTYQRKSSA